MWMKKHIIYMLAGLTLIQAAMEKHLAEMVEIPLVRMSTCTKSLSSSSLPSPSLCRGVGKERLIFFFPCTPWLMHLKCCNSPVITSHLSASLKSAACALSVCCDGCGHRNLSGGVAWLPLTLTQMDLHVCSSFAEVTANTYFISYII